MIRPATPTPRALPRFASLADRLTEPAASVFSAVVAELVSRDIFEPCDRFAIERYARLVALHRRHPAPTIARMLRRLESALLIGQRHRDP